VKKGEKMCKLQECSFGCRI